MSERRKVALAGDVAFSVSCVSADMRFGVLLQGIGYGPDVKADNSTDGVTCESLLRDLRAAQTRDDAMLGSTEKALLVILERIVGDEPDVG